MGQVARPNSYTAGTVIVASQVNSDLDTIYNEFNGGISNENIASDAAIDGTKIAAGSIGSAILSTGGVGSTNIASQAVQSSHISGGAVGSDAIANAAIVSGKIGTDAIKDTHIDYSSVKVPLCSAANTLLARGTVTWAVGTNATMQTVVSNVAGYFSDAIGGAVAFTNTDGPQIWVQKRVGTSTDQASYLGGFVAHDTDAHPLGQCVVYGKTSASFGVRVACVQSDTSYTHSFDWLAIGD